MAMVIIRILLWFGISVSFKNEIKFPKKIRKTVLINKNQKP